MGEGHQNVKFFSYEKIKKHVGEVWGKPGTDLQELSSGGLIQDVPNSPSTLW